MFSKVISRVSQYQSLSTLQSRAFRASAIANNKSSSKPSIGDAVTILQSKVSGINQVVSNLTRRWRVAIFICVHPRLLNRQACQKRVRSH
jgi:hypothetical protein